MKKGLASAVLSACLLVAALPVTAAAEEPQNAQQVRVGSVILTDGMGWNNDGSTTAHGSKGNNAYFDDGVLYLNDAEIQATYEVGISVEEGSLTIDLSGENAMYPQIDAEDQYYNVGIQAGELYDHKTGQLSIQGDGALYMEGARTGILACQGRPLSIRDAALYMDTSEITVRTYNRCDISGTAELWMICRSGEYGMMVSDLTISDDALLYCDAVNGYQSLGVAVGATDETPEPHELSITGGTVYIKSSDTALGVGGGNVNISNAVVELYTETGGGLSAGGYFDPDTISTKGGTVSIDDTLKVKAGDDPFTAQEADDVETNFENYKYVCIAPSFEWENPFEDVTEEDWFYDAVSYVNQYGLMNGVADTQFAPKGKVTRAQAVQMVYAMSANYPFQYGLEAREYVFFDDVDLDAWYAEAACWGGGTGVVSGVGNNRFAPNVNVPREQFATILYSFAQKTGYDVSARASLDSFHDAAKVSGWAKNAMQWAVAEGVMSGTNKGNLNPKGTLTRAEAAAMLRSFVRATVVKA